MIVYCVRTGEPDFSAPPWQIVSIRDNPEDQERDFQAVGGEGWATKEMWDTDMGKKVTS
jgi:hypothetical protein